MGLVLIHKNWQKPGYCLRKMPSKCKHTSEQSLRQLKGSKLLSWKLDSIGRKSLNNTDDKLQQKEFEIRTKISLISKIRNSSQNVLLDSYITSISDSRDHLERRTEAEPRTSDGNLQNSGLISLYKWIVFDVYVQFDNSKVIDNNGDFDGGNMQQKRTTVTREAVLGYDQEHSRRYLPILPQTDQTQSTAYLCPIRKIYLLVHPHRKSLPCHGLIQKQQYYWRSVDHKDHLQDLVRNLRRRFNRRYKCYEL